MEVDISEQLQPRPLFSGQRPQRFNITDMLRRVVWPKHTPPLQPDPSPASREPLANFSTMVGPLGSLERVIERWQELVEAADRAQPGRAALSNLDPPRMLPQTDAFERTAPDALRVARLAHAIGQGPDVVARLGLQLSSSGFDDVTVEEGYLLYPAARTIHPPGPWSVAWNAETSDAAQRGQAIQLAPHLLGAAFANDWPYPRKVVVIDSGDDGAVTQYGFTHEKSGPEHLVDHRGHGSAVGSLIRLVAPEAEVHSFRVIQPDDLAAESGIFLTALNEAVYPGGPFHVVAIPLRVDIHPLDAGRGQSMVRIFSRAATSTAPAPVVVCAAGNKRGKATLMSYPAIVPGVVVATGRDWSGEIAAYNCTVPDGLDVFTVSAPGGTSSTQALGSITRPGSRTEAAYGSSYATAFIAGAVARLPVV